MKKLVYPENMLFEPPILQPLDALENQQLSRMLYSKNNNCYISNMIYTTSYETQTRTYDKSSKD
jgi:hypothetical protein